MEDLAGSLLPWVQYAVTASFAAVAISALTRGARGGPSASWAAAAFASLTAALLGFYVPGTLDRELPAALAWVPIVLLLLFPYLLLRFTASFRALPRWLEVAAGTAMVLVVMAGTTLTLATTAEEGGLSPVVGFFLLAVLPYWVLVSLATVVRLWRAGGGQPTVVRRSMRLMSVATAVLAVALLVVLQLGDRPGSALFAQGLALASGMGFGAGFAPPRTLRVAWRRPEQEALQRGTMAMIGATSLEEIAERLLAPTAAIVGGSAAAIVAPDGQVVASHGLPAGGSQPESDRAGSATVRQAVPLGAERGELVVWTSRYVPFFGRDEIDLLGVLGAVVGLALERCEMIAVEASHRRSLEQARGEAERANAAKSEFLSRMSHELRTPMNVVLGFAQMLELADLPDEDRDGVAQILKAGRHLLALIDDILDLSRVEAGQLAVSPEAVHVGELIGDAVDLMRPLATSRSIQLVTDPEACDAYVTTDRQRSRQILLNLLSNAVKYNYDGGQVHIACRQHDSSLRVSVRDTGPGIDPASLDRLFQPFDRLGAENTSVEGTGLGLALSSGLVEALGGSIGVESQPGNGSTFWIDLPLADDPPSAPSSHPDLAAETEPSSALTVLLIEDNLANVRVVQAMLRRRPGIELLPAMQGTIGIELARQHQPDLILLDLHLPDLPGQQVLHRLRADPQTRDIPVVVVSADATAGTIRRLREAGAADYLPKPIDLKRFLEVLDKAVGGEGAAVPGSDRANAERL